jgi:hypothetical protein
MCRSRLWLLYWVSTHILRIPALARLDSAKSISRYTPPNGTAGLARSSVSGASRVPAPPASTIPSTDGSVMHFLPAVWCRVPGARRLAYDLDLRRFYHPRSLDG